jgi:hypothetical protein
MGYVPDAQSVQVPPSLDNIHTRLAGLYFKDDLPLRNTVVGCDFSDGSVSMCRGRSRDGVVFSKCLATGCGLGMLDSERQSRGRDAESAITPCT